MSAYKQCTVCGKIHEDPHGREPHEQWWWLTDYGDKDAKFSGYFCSSCYQIVALDTWGVPKNPKARMELFHKLQQKK